MILIKNVLIDVIALMARILVLASNPFGDSNTAETKYLFGCISTAYNRIALLIGIAHINSDRYEDRLYKLILIVF